MSTDALVVCWWCVGSVSADVSVGSDSLPLPQFPITQIDWLKRELKVPRENILFP